MLKVLGILGSARQGGNTELLLENTVDGAKAAGAEVELIRLSNLKINPCTNCGGCDEDGECIQLLCTLISPRFFMRETILL